MSSEIETLRAALQEKEEQLQQLQAELDFAEEMFGKLRARAEREDTSGLPMPRLELRWIGEPEASEGEWEYNLVANHFNGVPVFYPLGNTEVTGGASAYLPTGRIRLPLSANVRPLNSASPHSVGRNDQSGLDLGLRSLARNPWRTAVNVSQDFPALVAEIDAMVQAVASAPSLGDSDLRQTLRFISQVVQVVEQAFQDVYTLLVEVKYLEAHDLQTPKIRDLRKQADLLIAQSHYRDAAEICSRLKHLRLTFDSTVRPALSSLPELSSWQGVIGLIEDREGRIIRLITDTALDIQRMLGGANAGSIAAINSSAAASADLLKNLLSELHDLNGRILGYSGQAGLLELTRNRQQLSREIQIMIDKRDQSVTHGHRVQVGDNNTIGNLVTATSIADSFNQVRSSSASTELKAVLEKLCGEVEDLSKRLPEDKRKEVQQDLAALVGEATKQSPRQKWYELSASGLVEAAKACAGIASPVITTVKKVLALLAGAA